MAADSNNKVYSAAPTLAKFHASNAHQRWIRGPIGSGKSVATQMEMIRRAKEMPAQSDGVRRSRAVICRNTLSQLKTTTLVTWMEWLRPISKYKVSDQTIQVRFGLPDGTRVELDVFLLPLDTPENIQRLLSLELTYGILSEFRELPLEIAQAVMSRCGRYPSRANMRDYFYGCWGESNSFSVDSEWYEYLEISRPASVDYFIQPGGRDAGAENIEHLPQGYYENLVESNADNWVASYVDNILMPSLSGQAVYANSFDTEYHVAEEELKPIYGRNVVVGIDVGRNPAATIGQIDTRGRLLVLDCIWAENVGIEVFLDQYLRPALADRFAGMAFYAVLDPASRQRSQIGEKSVLEVVQESGMVAVPASTNAIAPRLRAVEDYLNRRDGMLICPVHCNDLVLGFQYHYRFKRRKGDRQLEEVPEKSHPWSDIHDSCQYLCLGIESRVMARQLARTVQRELPPEPTAAGWT